MIKIYPKLIAIFERHRFLVILGSVVALYLIVAWTTGLCTVCGVIARFAGSAGPTSCAP